MFYRNFVSRFLLRKDFFQRLKMRLTNYFRLITRNGFDDIQFLFSKARLKVNWIIDGGANIGFVSWQFKKKFPYSTIFSFEPNPEIFKILEKSYSVYFKTIQNPITKHLWGQKLGLVKYNG